MIYLFLADGFEEVEALAPLDMLRRANLPVTTVGIGTKTVCGAHNISVIADITDHEMNFADIDGVILPGGMPGTKNLEASTTVQKALDLCWQSNNLIAAICAAPSILGHKGFLQGKKATCFPGFEEDCVGAEMQPQGVVIADNIITARGAGCGLTFGAAIVAYYKDQAFSKKLLQDMQWDYEGHSRI